MSRRDHTRAGPRRAGPPRSLPPGGTRPASTAGWALAILLAALLTLAPASGSAATPPASSSAAGSGTFTLELRDAHPAEQLVAAVSRLPDSSRAELIFEESLIDGRTLTAGVSLAAVRDEGVAALDISPLIHGEPAQEGDIPGAGEDAAHRSAIALTELQQRITHEPASPDRIIGTWATPSERVAVEHLADELDASPVLEEAGPASASDDITESGSDVSETTAVSGHDEGLTDSDDACTYFSAKSGSTRLGESSQYPGKRYTQTFATWSQARVDHIASNCSVNSTYEVETHTTDAAGHYLGEFYRWSSTLPESYQDTGAFDEDNEVDGRATKQWTVGTFQLDEVRSDVEYRATIWTDPGSQGDGDLFMSNGQLGVKQPSICSSTWCVFAVDAFFLAEPWTGAPGVKTWEKSDDAIT